MAIQVFKDIIDRRGYKVESEDRKILHAESHHPDAKFAATSGHALLYGRFRPASAPARKTTGLPYYMLELILLERALDEHKKPTYEEVLQQLEKGLQDQTAEPRCT